MNVEPEIILAAVAIMAVASCVQGSIGFGCGLLAIPLFALLDPDLVPGPIFVGNAALTTSTRPSARNGKTSTGPRSEGRRRRLPRNHCGFAGVVGGAQPRREPGSFSWHP